MLVTIAIIFIALWALGLITSTTIGGGLHLLLVAAIVIIALSLFQGRKNI